MSELTLSGLIFGVFAMLFVTPYFMAKGVTYFGDEEFPIGKRLICMIPVPMILIWNGIISLTA